MQYHSEKIQDLLKHFNTCKEGLKETESRKRLERYGYNEIEEKHKISKLKIFINQFKSFIVFILIAAVIISLLINEVLDAIVIAIILIINAILGFIQEYKAEKSIEALKELTPLKAKVIRDNKEEIILSKFLVPGDIILLEEGDKIPADSRLIEAYSLEVMEASLTGESTPISKKIDIIDKDIGLADRKNMVYSSTIITRGKGKALVVATGIDTELGKIASLIEEVKAEETPLQRKLGVLGKYLGVATIVICIIIFLLGILRGGGIAETFIVAIALAVAAIPEGLPAVVTISLALGLRRMVKRNALIRKLPSVETLGGVTVIASDKTGTLTMNEMTVRRIFVNNKIINVEGHGYIKEGKFSENPKKFNLLLTIGALCNNAVINKEVIGDPTEAALIIAAEKANLKKEYLEKNYPRIYENPFSSERKMMSTLHKDGKKKILFVKGAPDIILKKCNRLLENNKVKKLNEKRREQILEINNKFARDALRVLGFAYSMEDKEENLVFVGLQGMIDPPRKEVKKAIEKCKKAGIKVIMITGDHKLTASAIAKELDIKGEAITGEDLDKIPHLEDVVEHIAIYARVNPSHKIKIVEALKKKGHIVAMTGDGVNDAPALKKADMGIAMNITGTDVAKESSDMILLDDNFASIVNAVEEGRGIYDNIKKFVNYLLSTNFGEILVIFIAGLIGLPLPLIALQILWINLITDGLPALALGVDPIDKKIMERGPKIDTTIVDKRMVYNIIFIGFLIAAVALSFFKYGLNTSLGYARTLAFSSLIILEIVRIQMVRSHYNVGVFSNKYLILAVLSSIALLLLVIYTPLSIVFKTVAISFKDWFFIVLVAIILFMLSYFGKIIKDIRHHYDKVSG